jgi:hypothetical protein
VCVSGTQANPHSALVGPLRALATGTAPLLTTNYDTFLERVLNRNALYYQDILPCQFCTRIVERHDAVQVRCRSVGSSVRLSCCWPWSSTSCRMRH